MYGDCVVTFPSLLMDGNTTTNNNYHDGIFFSSPVRNPSNVDAFGYMGSIPDSFHSFPSSLQAVKEEKRKEEIMLESMSGSVLNNNIEGLGGGVCCNELDSRLRGYPPPSKKKRYHRHTTRQIQELEALFRICPHPDDKQRMKLSQELGLKPRQVKFWFQNRRTQLKVHQDRTDNVILRAENNNLENKNYHLQAVLRSLVCPCCGGGSILGEVEHDEHQLRLENARLKDELDRVRAVVSRSNRRPIELLQPPPPLSRHFHEIIMPSHTQMLPETTPFTNYGNRDGGLILDKEIPLAMEHAKSSMNELQRMCHINEPLWIRDTTSTMYLLSKEEYSRMFSSPGGYISQHCNALKIEATRETAVVSMNSVNLVDVFLDANKWVEMFPSVVSRAKTIQVLASGVSGRSSGSLHLMYAELIMLTPLVSTREIHFLRYVHQNVKDGTSTIFDFPVDNFGGSLQLSQPMFHYIKRPSGCVIQDMPNGFSKITWVEHDVILNEKPSHQIFAQHIHNGAAFGAKRWLAVLQRQCERLTNLTPQQTISNLGVIQSGDARKNLMKVAQRMVRSFCVSMSCSGGQLWTALSENKDDTVRITTRKVVKVAAGEPSGLILTAISTTCLEYSCDRVFDLLSSHTRRSQIEALSNSCSLHEVANITTGSHPANFVSLFRVNAKTNSSENAQLILQESSTAPSEFNSIQLIMSRKEDSSSIPLLPTGFSIIPNKDGVHGCLLTVGVQVHVSANPNAILDLSSVTSINDHICSVVQQIKVVLADTSQ